MDDKQQYLKAASDLLNRGPVFIDTETTGLGPRDEVVEVCAIDTDGVVLFDSLIKPTVPIDPGASAVTGITAETVKDSPAFAQAIDRLMAVVRGRAIVTYNAAFDSRLLKQSAQACGRLVDWRSAASDYSCAMLLYADYYGEFDEYRRQNRWQKLGAAAQQCGLSIPANLHNARADAELARRIIVHLAALHQPEYQPE